MEEENGEQADEQEKQQDDDMITESPAASEFFSSSDDDTGALVVHGHQTRISSRYHSLIGVAQRLGYPLYSMALSQCYCQTVALTGQRVCCAEIANKSQRPKKPVARNLLPVFEASAREHAHRPSSPNVHPKPKSAAKPPKTTKLKGAKYDQAYHLGNGQGERKHLHNMDFQQQDQGLSDIDIIAESSDSGQEAEDEASSSESYADPQADPQVFNQPSHQSNQTKGRKRELGDEEKDQQCKRREVERDNGKQQEKQIPEMIEKENEFSNSRQLAEIFKCLII